MKRKQAAVEKIEGGLWVKDGFARGPEPESPVVSVITVCLNSAQHIEQTIESVLGQTYGEIEYIVVDGGSSDGTLDILRKYDESISYWVSEPDEGIYSAMNKGISLATGGLVGIINSDDWYFPETVEAVVGASLEDPDAQVFFGPLYVTDENGNLGYVWEGTDEGIEQKFRMNHPTCFVRKTVYDDYHYSEEFRLLADYDLMLRLHLAGMRFHRIDRPLAWFRTGGSSSAYYRSRADSYDIMWRNGLLSPWQYVYKRLSLVFKAPHRAFRNAVARTFFKEIDELRRERGHLFADNQAMKEEIARASAHIANVEDALAGREAEVARLNAEVARLSLALEAAMPDRPAGGYLRRIRNRLAGL